MQFVVLSSSRGTTFGAVLDAIKTGMLKATCIGLVTDRYDRGCAGKADRANLPVKVVEKKEGETREEYDKRLDAAIHSLGSADIIASLGWMWIHSPWFIQRWKNRIVNTHPALLPKYGGKGMYGDHVHKAVLESGDGTSGITIHLLDKGVDTGRILLQKSCAVSSGDTVETLRDRVQKLEKEWFPKVLQMVEDGEVKL